MAAGWTPELIVNDELLDSQHVELFRALGRAAGALDSARGGEVAERVAAFAEAFVEHVAVEEALMEDTLWPERARHRAAHELFGADLQRIRDEIGREGITPVVAGWVRDTAPDWLRFHIRTNDAPFAAHLARRRQAGPFRAPRPESKRH